MPTDQKHQRHQTFECLVSLQVVSVDDEPINHMVLRALLGPDYELLELVRTEMP